MKLKLSCFDSLNGGLVVNRWDHFRSRHIASFRCPADLCDLPDGLSGDFRVQSLREKYSAFPVGQITFTNSPVPPHRGAARDRHGREAGCGGRKWRF
jgi:hypothetical protein